MFLIFYSLNKDELINMSEEERNSYESEDKTSYCTGWGIIDGFIMCFRKIKTWRQNRKKTIPPNLKS